MNLKYIQGKLNEIFNEKSRQLVFWYDEKAEFCDEISNLKLDNAQIYFLKQDNWLYTKYFLEVEDTNNNYLIYAPFPQPKDEDNYLADMVYYANTFSADKISLIMQELNIPEKYKPVLENYSKFWNANSRVTSFKDLDIEKYSERKIKVAILCVLTQVKIVSFDELLRKVLTEEDLKHNQYLAEFEKMDILDSFWDLSQEKYGYEDKNPSIEKFLISLIITYTATQFRGNIPKTWEKLLLNKKNNIAVFINNIMNNTYYKDKYDNIASLIASKINLEGQLKRIPVENYFKCDTFEVFDKNITEHLNDLLVSNQEELPFGNDLLAERQKTHFYQKFINHYEVVKQANLIIKHVNEFSKEPYTDNIQEFITSYCNKWSYIDRYYRKFYYAYDKIPDQDKNHDLRQLVENMYTNTYLSDLAIKWSEKLENLASIRELPISKQYNFYRKSVVRAFKKQKTAVIISDAFRYECGEELKEKLNKDPTRKTTIKPLVSTIPSFTALGMASLLPHNQIMFDKNFKTLVDGKQSSSAPERQKILEKYNPDALVLTYDEVMTTNMDNLRAILKNKNLVYIYHNQIDARGDKLATENEVFTASEEASEEIIQLITKLTNQASFYNHLITADHGFIYKRDKLNESDKVDLTQKSIQSRNKRYLLSDEELNIQGTSNYKLDYLDMDDIYVTVPRGMDIFKTPGAGQNYVHGGSSLQEIIIPLIHVKSKSEKKKQEYVKLNLISINNRLTNLSTMLTFAQKENISNSILPLEAKLYFEDEYEEKISNEVIIHANKNVDSAQDREFKEKFTLRNREYSKSKKYYLIIKNMMTNEEEKYEFMIDIAFSDDFMF